MPATSAKAVLALMDVLSAAVLLMSSGLQQTLRAVEHCRNRMLRKLRLLLLRRSACRRHSVLLTTVIAGLLLLIWRHNRPQLVLKDKDLKLFAVVPEIDDRPAIVLAQEKLLFCPMYKNLHIPMLALLCRKASENDRTIELDYRRLGVAAFSLNLISFCLPKLSKFDEDMHSTVWQTQPDVYDEDGELESWRTVAIIRNPFERFLATWNFVCYKKESKDPKYCYGCKDNLGCFIREQFAHFRNISLKKATYTVFNGDAAFYPQSWHCDLSKHAEQYTHKLQFTKDESFFEELRNTFIGFGWEDIVNSGWGLDAEEKFLEDHTGLPTSADDTVIDRFQKLLKQNLNYANLVFKTYYADFHYLKLHVPDYVKDACRKARLPEPNSEEEYDEHTETKHFAVCRFDPR